MVAGTATFHPLPPYATRRGINFTVTRKRRTRVKSHLSLLPSVELDNSRASSASHPLSRSFSKRGGKRGSYLFVRRGNRGFTKRTMELAWVNRGRRKVGRILEIEISGRSVDCFLFLSEKMGKERGNIFRQMSQLERIIVACRVIEIRKNISIISRPTKNLLSNEFASENHRPREYIHPPSSHNQRSLI